MGFLIFLFLIALVFYAVAVPLWLHGLSTRVKEIERQLAQRGRQPVSPPAAPVPASAPAPVGASSDSLPGR